MTKYTVTTRFPYTYLTHNDSVMQYALPGDTLEVTDEAVLINGEETIESTSLVKHLLNIKYITRD